MKTDALDRRHRNVPQPKGAHVVLTPRNMRVLAALRRHGPLPTPLLYHFWRDEGGNYKNFQAVLTRLFHEKESGGPFVTRPPELNPDGPNPEPAWYDLSPAGYAAVQAEAAVVLPTKRDHMHHRAMGACISASFELGAGERGLTYLTLDEILTHRNTPERTKLVANPLAVKLDSGWLEPDGLIGFKNAEGRFRFFAREEDRATEPFTRQDKLQQSLRLKLDKYIELLAGKIYASQWGLPSLRVLFTTTAGPARIQSARDYLAGSPYARCFHFKSLPTFRPLHWKAPRAPLAELFEPWMTVDGLRDPFA